MNDAGANICLHPRLIEQYPWAQMPNVSAPSPSDRSASIRLAISKPYILGNLHKAYRTPMYQAWFHLTGEWPPTPNLSEVSGGTAQPGTLADSTACFKGIKRPHLTEDDGASIFVYILKPESTLVFDPRPPVRRPVIKMLDSDLILAAYVRLADRPVLQGGEAVDGFVTRLETLEAGPGEPGLPVDHLERYEHRVW